jgi:hypothetical protein
MGLVAEKKRIASYFRKVLDWFVAIIPVILTCVYPVLFLYSKNIKDVSLTESMFIVLAYVLVGIIVFIASRLLLKNLVVASTFATVFMSLFLNFPFIKSIVSSILSKNVNLTAFILFIFLFGMAAFLLVKYRKSELVLKLNKILLIAISFLTIINLVPVAWHFISLSLPVEIVHSESGTVELAETSEITGSAKQNTIESEVQKSSFNMAQFIGKFSSGERRPNLIPTEERDALEKDGTVKPNVYFFILDEAARFDVMEEFYNFDCSEIESFFTSRKFNISYSSISRILMSDEALADMCQLSYVSKEDMSKELKLYYRLNGLLWQEFNNLGYDVFQVSSDSSYLYSLYEITHPKRMETLFAANTMDGKTQLDLAIENTPLSVFNFGLTRFSIESKRARVLRVWDYFLTNQNIQYANSTVIFSHILCPHCPFVFAEDGDYIPDIDAYYDWDTLSYYAGQYKYAMNQMEKICDKLIEDDPNCVIIIMGDHGVRPRSSLRTKMHNELTDYDMRKFFNVVYFRGETLDIEGLDGVNTLRKVITALGGDYPIIQEEPPMLTWPYWEKMKDND